MKVKWTGPDQAHAEVGDLKHGETYEVPEDLGKAWIAQRVAERSGKADKAKDKE